MDTILGLQEGLYINQMWYILTPCLLLPHLLQLWRLMTWPFSIPAINWRDLRKTEEDLDASKPAPEGNMHMKYLSDLLFRGKYRTVTKHDLQELNISIGTIWYSSNCLVMWVPDSRNVTALLSWKPVSALALVSK